MTIDDYIKNGCTVENALITGTDISIDDYPIVSISLRLSSGFSVVFGGVMFGRMRDDEIIGWDKGITAIFRILQLADVSHWDELAGRPLRAILRNNSIVAIAHFLDADKVLDYAELAKVCPCENVNIQD